MKKKDLPSWVPEVGIFLLKSLGWIAISILVILFTSYFVKFPTNRADLFTTIEILFGIVITALTVVASFAVSFQWNLLENNIRVFKQEITENKRQIDVDMADLRSNITSYEKKISQLESNAEEANKKVQQINQLVASQNELLKSLRTDTIKHIETQNELLASLKSRTLERLDDTQNSLKELSEIKTMFHESKATLEELSNMLAKVDEVIPSMIEMKLLELIASGDSSPKESALQESSEAG